MVFSKVVRPLGFEPRTHRLKVYHELIVNDND